MSVIRAITSIDYGDVAARAAWTFAQTFLGVFLLSGASLIELLFNAGWDELFAALFATCAAALAAGMSAVKTIVLETYREIQQKAQEEDN